jgi:hypothetical protein
MRVRGLCYFFLYDGVDALVVGVGVGAVLGMKENEHLSAALEHWTMRRAWRLFIEEYTWYNTGETLCLVGIV